MKEAFGKEWDDNYKYMLHIKLKNEVSYRDYLILFYYKQESIEDIYRIGFISDRKLNDFEQKLLAESTLVIKELPKGSKIRARWYGASSILKKELQEIIHTEQINIQKKILENRLDPEHKEIISYINKQVNLEKYKNQL